MTAHTFHLRVDPDRHAFVSRLRGLQLPLKVTIRDADARSLAQNDLLWALLTDVSEQVVWHGQKLTTEDWKNIFTAGLKRYKVVPGLEGGFVAIGMSTSAMSKREFSELIELIRVFGAEHQVVFKETE